MNGNELFEKILLDGTICPIICPHYIRYYTLYMFWCKSQNL